MNLTDELISKFSNLSEEQQTEVINVIIKFDAENEKRDLDIVEKILMEQIDLFNELAKS